MSRGKALPVSLINSFSNCEKSWTQSTTYDAFFRTLIPLGTQFSFCHDARTNEAALNIFSPTHRTRRYFVQRASWFTIFFTASTPAFTVAIVSHGCSKPSSWLTFTAHTRAHVRATLACELWKSTPMPTLAGTYKRMVSQKSTVIMVLSQGSRGKRRNYELSGVAVRVSKFHKQPKPRVILLASLLDETGLALN